MFPSNKLCYKFHNLLTLVIEIPPIIAIVFVCLLITATVFIKEFSFDVLTLTALRAGP